MVVAAISSSLAAAVALTNFHAYSPETPEGLRNRARAPFWAFVHDYEPWLIFGLTLLAAVLSITISAIQEVQRRRRQRQRIASYLQRVHERSFPHRAEDGAPAGGMDLACRISLYVPRKAGWYTRDRVLRCEFRTDRTKAKRAWPLSEEPRKGIVVRAWCLRAALVAEPPDSADPCSVQKYLASTWMTEQDRHARSWPDAGMCAAPIITTPTSDPVAVLLVEARDRPIAADELQWDAPTLAMLLDGL